MTEALAHQALAGLDPCVRCGFCLQSCPTFLVTGDEADGPRGRIALMQQFGRQPATADAALVVHLDRCLGCRACETVCPAGVRYGPALEAVRAKLAATRPLPWAVRLTNAVMGDGFVRRAFLGVLRRLAPFLRHVAGRSRLRFMLGMLVSTTLGRRWFEQHRSGRNPRAEPGIRLPKSTEAGRVIVFRGCVMDGLFGHVHAATAHTLAHNGYAVEEGWEGCCGALHAHAGDHSRAVALARRNVAAWRERAGGGAMPFLAVNSAGCGAALREYGRLLAADPLAEDARTFAEHVRDVSELLAARGPLPGAPLPLRLAYDPPCHLLHAQRVAEAPLAVLAAIPQAQVVAHEERDLCCGSAGTYSLAEPDMARAVLHRKLEALLAARPDVVVTGNPGCIMHIGAGLLAMGDRTPVVHPVELLDWSYQLAGCNGAKCLS